MELSYYLGANACGGFYSLYEEFLQDRDPAYVWVLKGGAGCGKSSFLRRVAAYLRASGCSVEEIPCSGDPQSLDGIYVPDKGAALFDGTAPHVLEPRLVGQRGSYVDLSRFYRMDSVKLEEAERCYKEHYRRAYQFLSAAGHVEDSILLPDAAAASVLLRAERLAARELRRQDGGRRVRRLFTDAFTCMGRISLPETREAFCPRRIGLTGSGAETGLFLETILQAALHKGYSPVVCPDPLRPERPAHVLLPEQGLGFVTGDDGERRLHLDRLVREATDAEEAAAVQEAQRLRAALLDRAQRELAMAKLWHDRLEEAVHPLINFAGVEALADETAQELLHRLC